MLEGSVEEDHRTDTRGLGQAVPERELHSRAPPDDVTGLGRLTGTDRCEIVELRAEQERLPCARTPHRPDDDPSWREALDEARPRLQPLTQRVEHHDRRTHRAGAEIRQRSRGGLDGDGLERARSDGVDS